jgi:hypothetical protein
MKIKSIKDSNFKYIFFPEEMEMYRIKPYVLYPTRAAFQDTSIIKWESVEVAIGEDLIDLGYKVKSERGCESSWYIVKDSYKNVPGDRRYHALVGLYA